MEKSHFSPIDQVQVQGIKICAGSGCSNAAKYPLTILYLNKVGWFCGSCRDSLVKDGIAFDFEIKNVDSNWECHNEPTYLNFGNGKGKTVRK